MFFGTAASLWAILSPEFCKKGTIAVSWDCCSLHLRGAAVAKEEFRKVDPEINTRKIIAADQIIWLLTIVLYFSVQS